MTNDDGQGDATTALAVVIHCCLLGWTLNDTARDDVAWHSPTAARIIDIAAGIGGDGWEAASARLRAVTAAGINPATCYGCDPQAACEDVVGAAIENLAHHRAQQQRRHQLLSELARLGDP